MCELIPLYPQSFPDVKSKLDVTISVHVYSVQKAELKDSAPLYSTDYDAMKENLKNCTKYVTLWLEITTLTVICVCSNKLLEQFTL